MRVGTGHWESFERWSSTAFVVAGVVWFADAILLGIELLGLYPTGAARSGLVLFGLIVSSIGLFGLYRRLAVRTPRVAIASAVVVAAGGVMLIAQLVWGIGAFVLPAVSNPPDITTLFIGILVVGGFVSVGITGLYTGVPSTAVGVLLLAYVAAFIGAVALTDWLQFGLVGVLSVVTVAIGYLLHTGVAPPYRANPSSDSAASEPPVE